ncbi:hypothetical protein [Caviibacter abscessus]|uniref:hypothetical protein n=1 Tax=Caviibacter abscessus TaxID=1766719 RepID=UPI000836E757|nr:hypothetical protein [Caviibacter abscessus]
MKKNILFVLMSIILFSCGISPEKTVDTFLGSVKEKKIEEAIKYTDDAEFAKNLEIKYGNQIQETFFNALYRNFNYEILNVAVQEDKSVIVNVSVENIDVQKVFLEVFQSMFKKAFEGNADVKIEDELSKVLKNPNLAKIKVVDQYVLVKKSGKYKIKLTSHNVDKIFGGYYSTISNLTNLGR